MMNTKIRALLWEECRTGGVIAAWTALVGILAMLAIRLFEENWQFVSAPVMSIALGTALVATLLLLYRTGNSGHLTGGFSGRILLLPVETARAVACIMAMRALQVAAASGLTFAACHGIFGFGPPWILLLLLPALYLIVQCLDWLRRPLPVVAAAGLAALVVALALGYAAVTQYTGAADEGNLFERLFYTLGEVSTGHASAPAGVWFATAAFLAITAAVTYGIALVGVRLARCGERRQAGLRLRLPEAVSLPFGPRGHTFASGRWAYLWRFLRKDGALFPLGVLALLIVHLLGGFILSYVVGTVGDSEVRISGDTVFEVATWIAFVLAALIWGGLRGGVGLQRGVRPSLTEYLYPMTSADMTATRLWGHALILGSTWLVLFVLWNIAFLTADDALAWRIYTQACAAGETDLREIIQTRLPIPLMALVVSWVFLTIRTRLSAWLIGGAAALAAVSAFSWLLLEDLSRGVACLIIATLALLIATGYAAWHLGRYHTMPWRGLGLAVPIVAAAFLGVFSDPPFYLPGWVAAHLVILAPAAAVIWAWWRGLVPRLALLLCGGVWIAAVLALYPYGWWILAGIDRVAVFYGLVAGSLVVFPYPALLIDIHRRRHLDDTPQDPAQHRHRTPWRLAPTTRIVVGAVLVALLLGAVWYRWPATPPYIENRRAEGKPATVADLAEVYAPGPPEINAAYHYLDVMRQQEELEEAWESLREQRENDADNPFARAYEKQNAFVYGSYDCEPGEMVWRGFWEVARARHAIVGAPVAEALEVIAHANYPQCRFPLNYGAGPNVQVRHLLRLRYLARSAAGTIWIAAMEDRPDEVMRHLRTFVPLAESLREEPLLRSQRVRIALHGIMNASVEQALSRTAFTDAQLAEIQHLLATALPPMADQSLFDLALEGEPVLYSESASGLSEAIGLDARADYLFNQRPFVAFNRMVIQRCYAEMEANNTKQSTSLVEDVEAATNPLYILSKILLPAFDRAREAEFRARVSHDMAATACAVERYRRANDALPPALDDLVPEFLDAVPRDPFRDDGGPISYISDADGGFVVYSWARNRKDDGAINPEDSEGRESDWHIGDWTFQVASPAFRDGPQITDVPPDPPTKRLHVGRM